MKENIHPNYKTSTVTCSCGNQFESTSTLCRNITIDVCHKCHPFYTQKQRIVDTGGRVSRFAKRFGSLNQSTPSAEAASDQKS